MTANTEEVREERTRLEGDVERASRARQHHTRNGQSIERERTRLQRRWIGLLERQARSHGTGDKELEREIADVKEQLDAIPAALAATQAATDAAHRAVQGATADQGKVLYRRLEVFLSDQDERVDELRRLGRQIEPLYRQFVAKWAEIESEYQVLRPALVDRTRDHETSHGIHRDLDLYHRRAEPAPCPLPPWPHEASPVPPGVAELRQLLTPTKHGRVKPKAA